jgi:uncharacterized repeat protein (TIGR02543 family)
MRVAWLLPALLLACEGYTSGSTGSGSGGPPTSGGSTDGGDAGIADGGDGGTDAGPDAGLADGGLADGGLSTFRLDVGINGVGNVRSNPAGIDCPSNCTHTFNQGAVVNLEATAASGYRFTGWTGACTGATCTVLMQQDEQVTATFELTP